MNFNELLEKVNELMGEPKSPRPFYWSWGDPLTSKAAWAMLTEETRGADGSPWAHLSFGKREDVGEELAVVREERAFLGPVDFVAAQGLPALVELVGGYAAKGEK